MANEKPPTLLLIRAHLMADPKKTVVLGVLTLVMVLVYVRLFLKGEPETAAADEIATSMIATPDSPSASTPEPSASEPVTVVTRPVMAIEDPLTHKLGRDPFQVPIADFYQVPGAAVTDPTKTDAKQIEEEIRAAAARLELQSTIRGQAPMATINGRILQIGDEIDGFEIVTIEPTYVMLRCNGIWVKLPLK